MQTLAIFDLDNTLLAGDSDHAWGEFLIVRGLVDATSYRAKNDAFYQDYLLGKLDINAYLEFALAILAGKTPDELRTLHADFMQTMIAPMMLNSAAELLQKHRDNGDYLLIITATNEFVTSPIARQLGVDHLLASHAEMRDGRYTGKTHGTPCFHAGKVERLQQWLVGHNFELDDAWFYSDSHNDTPLLQLVGKPVAVDPDDTLRAHAQRRQWPIISLRS